MTTFQYHLPDSTETYSAKVDAPSIKAKCGVLLGHGAGGDSESGNLPRIAQAFCDAGILCVRFDCKPPILAKRVAHAEACLLSAQKQFSVNVWLAAGHSMGARVASSLAHAQPALVIAAIFFSYPLHPPNKQEQLRDSPLVELQQPVLFIHGTSDNLCEEKQFKAVLKRMASSKREVYNVEGGDHSLKVKGGKAAAESAVARAIKAAVTFAKDVTDSLPEGVCTLEPPPSPEEETGVRRSRRPKHPPKRKRDAAGEEVPGTKGVKRKT